MKNILISDGFDKAGDYLRGLETDLTKIISVWSGIMRPRFRNTFKRWSCLILFRETLILSE